MAGFLSVYGANTLLGGVAMPLTLYVQGHLADPGNDGSSGGAAETRRFPIVIGTPAAGVALNSTVGSMSLAAANETWTHITLWDASSAGNCWWIVPLSVALSVIYLSTIRLDTGFLSLSFPRWGD